MILIMGAWYNEAGYSFKISHKVFNFVRELIKKEIFPKYNLDRMNDGWFLNLVIATDSQTKNLEVRGPEINKRQKMIDYGLWLPYHLITKSNSQLETFINYLFEALEIVFKNYGVNIKDLIDLKEVAKKEILNDDEYNLN